MQLMPCDTKVMLQERKVPSSIVDRKLIKVYCLKDIYVISSIN